MKNIRTFILGAPSVGKTSLIHQIVFGPVLTGPLAQPLPTIEDIYFATIDFAHLSMCDNKNLINRDDRILFFDVAGIKQSIDIELLRSYITYADEFILVYSINDRSTFNLVDTIKKLIDQSKGKKDIIVLGNKVDLDDQRQVGFDEALIWAKRENIKLFEVTSYERSTLLHFTRYLSFQLTTSQNHSTSAFKLRRSKTNQSTSGT